MSRVWRVPIRWKILVTVLLIVTGVVSVITFTMASLFHQDKRAYINDLVSVVALNTAEECRALLVGYTERLRVYGRIMSDDELSSQGKKSLMEGLFGEFPELVAIGVNDAEGEIVTAYNTAALSAAGLSRENLEAAGKAIIPPFGEIDESKVFVRNTTLSDKLPAMTVVTLTGDHGGGNPLLVHATVRLDALMDVAERAEAFELSVADAQGILLASSDPSKVAGREAAVFQPETTNLADSHGAVMTLELERDGVRIIGAYARTDIGGVVVAAEIPSAAAFLASRALLKRLLVVALVLLLLAAVVGLVWAYSITRPIARLSRATQEVAKGHFDIKVDVTGRDEMGTLASSFNQMAFELDSRETELNQTHEQLIQSEKLAAFGQLGAGIAHEVKNPLAGILGCAQLALRKAEPESSIHQNLVLIEKETKRCKTIIENLLKFARQERAAMKATGMNQVVEDAMAIVSHQLGLQHVKLQKELSESLPPIHGNANQLQQVFMNLMINAQQAMEGSPGTVKVITRRSDSGNVQVVISDDGPGMTDEVRQKLFEPFFTTKPGGKGTGLGLSVSFGIIKDHAGEIMVESEPGNGSTFTINIPAMEEQQPATSPALTASGDPAV